MAQHQKREIIQLLKRAQEISRPKFDCETLQILCLIAHAQECNRELRSARIQRNVAKLARKMNAAFKHQEFEREQYQCPYDAAVFMHLLDFYTNKTLQTNLCIAVEMLRQHGRRLPQNATYCPKFMILAALAAVDGCEVVCARNQQVLQAIGITYERGRLSESSFVCQNLNSDDGDYYSDIGTFIV